MEKVDSASRFEERLNRGRFLTYWTILLRKALSFKAEVLSPCLVAMERAF
ncbi:hypothetical protein VDG1235_666 [Verrucomicrobiia bacterium DG1235]|nr:hypothetical protein VDG1235_666 [Verrucomicrobiae bacterium DG1235]